MAEDPVQEPLCRTEIFQKIFSRKRRDVLCAGWTDSPWMNLKAPVEAALITSAPACRS